MDFSQVIHNLKNSRLAAEIYQREGRARFRDRLTIGRNGRVLFERFNYGEAAGLVFSMWGNCGLGGTAQAITWEDGAVQYSGKDEAPHQLSGFGGEDGAALLFDGKPALWAPHDGLKSWPKGGVSRLAVLFSKG